MLKILHIAPQNYAGVPYSFYEMHNACGDYSRLITLHKNQFDLPEDVNLNLPLPKFKLAKMWRGKKLAEREEQKITEAPLFDYKNSIEGFYFAVNDIIRKPRVNEIIKDLNLDEFDIIHYDAGLDFFRNSSQAKKWKNDGKKIVCCYYGSDLRTRGIIKDLDDISDLNITSEFDHLALKKDLKYIFYPYDTSELPEREYNNSDKIRIVHSPTNRKFKGTDLIISVIERIKKEKNIEFVLLENIPRREVLDIKKSCDVCIDQVGGTMGGTGYGKAGIETLGMGIPTITNMTDDYNAWLPENPFVVANNSEQLYDNLCLLIEDKSRREELGIKGKLWVNKYHGFKSVNERLYELYKESGII